MYTERVAWSRVWWVLLLSPVILVLALVAVQTSGSRTPGLVTAGAIAVLMLAFGYAFRALAISIDDRQLTVGFPVYRRRVPLDEVVACRPIRYRWWEYGGYGIRRGRGGTMLNVGGDGGRAVEIARCGQGPLQFSSRDPEAVCAAIRARRPDLATG